jgi:hypothetical protein
MPRYFFHVQDGATILDDEGTELPDLAAAKDEAISTSGQMLKDGGIISLWNGTPWKMWVTNEAQKTLFTVNFSATVE